MVKNPPVNAGDIRDEGSMPAPGRLPGRGHWNTLQYSCLENPRQDKEAEWSTVHGVAKSWIQLKLLNMHAGPFYSKCGTWISIISITGQGGGLVRNAESQASC